MTLEEYIIKKKDLQKKHDYELYALAKDYAFSHNPHEKGDIIEDHIGKIIIEKIQHTRGNGYDEFPICVYTGLVLKKDGKPTKKKKERSVWQTNLKNI